MKKADFWLTFISGFLLGMIICGTVVKIAIHSFKDEAATRGYAEYVTDGKKITFKWKEKE